MVTNLLKELILYWVKSKHITTMPSEKCLKIVQNSYINELVPSFWLLQKALHDKYKFTILANWL